MPQDLNRMVRFPITYPSLDGVACELPFVIGVITDVVGDKKSDFNQRPFTLLCSSDSNGISDPSKTKLPISLRNSAGLTHLIDTCKGLRSVQIVLLSATLDELLKDVQSSPTVEDIRLYEIICAQRFETFGGSPLSLLVLDYDFALDSNDSKHLAILRAFTSIGSLCDLSIVTSFDIKFLPATVDRHRKPLEACNNHFQGFSEWMSFRRESVANNLFVAVPHVRLTGHRGQSNQTEAAADASSHSTPPALSVNGPYCVASRVALAHDSYGWPATFSAELHPQMGLSVDLECTMAKNNNSVRLPPFRWAQALSKSGLLPIIGRTDSDFAAIFHCSSAAAESDSSQLVINLLTARISHHLHALRRQLKDSHNSARQRLDIIKQCIESYVGDRSHQREDWPPLQSRKFSEEESAGGSRTLNIAAMTHLPGVNDLRPIRISLKLQDKSKPPQGKATHASASEGEVNV